MQAPRRRSCDQHRTHSLVVQDRVGRANLCVIRASELFTGSAVDVRQGGKTAAGMRGNGSCISAGDPLLFHEVAKLIGARAVINKDLASLKLAYALFLFLFLEDNPAAYL